MGRNQEQPVRHGTPRELLKHLEKAGLGVDNPSLGIYYIHIRILEGVHIQIVASGELDPEAHVWLSALTDDLTEAQAMRLMDEVGVLGDEKEQELADSVLFVAARENLDVFQRLKKVSDMRFIRLLFEDEIARVVAQKDAEIAQIADAAARKDNEISMLRAQLAAAGIAAGSN